MSSLYDRLTDKIGDEKTEGITPLDIADLPEPLKQVMFSLLRDPHSNSEGVLLDAPQGHRIDQRVREQVLLQFQARD